MGLVESKRLKTADFKPSRRKIVVERLRIDCFGECVRPLYRSPEAHRVLCSGALRCPCTCQMLEALLDNDLEELGTCWKSLCEADRACATLWAMLLGRDAIIAWIMSRPGFPTEDFAFCMRAIGPFDKHLLTKRGKQCPSEAALRAALQCRVTWDDLENLSDRLLGVGGQDLALLAIDCGYSLRFPAQWDDPSLITEVVDHGFIAQVQAQGVSTAWLVLSRALRLRFKDLALLRDFVAMPNQRDYPWKDTMWALCECPLEDLLCLVRYLPLKGMLLALRDGWAPGVQLLLKAFGVWRALPVAEAALANPGLACLDLLLEEGLGDLLFVCAFEEGQFDAVETLIRKGCLEPAGKHMPRLPCCYCKGPGSWEFAKDPPKRWASSLWDIFQQCKRGLGRQETPSAQRLASVVAQIHPLAAEELAPEIQEWREQMRASAVPLLQWWALQSRACAERHGCAGSCRLPHVLEAILVQAGFMGPSVERRAQAVAAKMRTWMQVGEGGSSGVEGAWAGDGSRGFPQLGLRA
eukprot:jgi/Botrbrau1/17123/Bobra.0157s0024.1